MYASVPNKFLIAVIIASVWMLFSIWIAIDWYHALATHIGKFFSGFVITFIAIIPGFINTFVVISLMLDKRPTRTIPTAFPPLSILIAAYNEASNITNTLQSIEDQCYPGELDVIVINDGSRDATRAIVKKYAAHNPWLRLINVRKNAGKAHALDVGLEAARHAIIVTIDADTYLYKDALIYIVERYLSDPQRTKAIAGTILVRNSRDNWVTRAQEWDYFHGIAAIKRVQSLYQGTLVAQGAFSLYDKQALIEACGWPNTVGEDIVLTWALLAAGYRVGHCEEACAFTRVPDTLKGFIGQRQRWARGMIEAFKYHSGTLFKKRLSTFFIWWDLLFPLLDITFTFGFIPGLILAMFGKFWIAGPMTLAVLPFALMLNGKMFQVGKAMFDAHGLKVRRNRIGFIIYLAAYNLILQPVCVYGYCMELFNLKRTWGTK